MTPGGLIDAIVTEAGVHRSPYLDSLAVNAVILAGGYATRLRPLTDTIPKPLLPVGGRPIVDWILENAREVPRWTRSIWSRTAALPTSSAAGRGLPA